MSSQNCVVNQAMIRLPEDYPSFEEAYVKKFPNRKNPLPPIKGGWGYTKEDAVVIRYDDRKPEDWVTSIDCVEVEKYFITFRLEEETLYAHKTIFPGPEWEKVNHQLVFGDDGRMFDCETVEASVFTLDDWEYLKQDWKSHDGYKDDEAGMARHHQMREERKIRFTEVFWFDITECM